MTADAQTLREIAERVEALTGPDREVDALIQQAVFMDGQGMVGDICAPGWVCGVGENPTRSPLYTASVDAALTLVPQGLSLGFTVPYQRGAIVSAFWPRPRADLWKPLEQAVGRGEAATAPLALCAAALRAVATSQEQRRDK